MKRKIIIWGILTIISYGLLILIVENVSFMYNENLKYVTLSQYDDYFLVDVYASLILVGVVCIILALMKVFKDGWLHKGFVSTMMVTPAFPLIFSLFSLISFHILKIGEYYYFGIGSDFSLALHTEYPDSMSVLDLKRLGESLTYGVGLYLVIFVLLIIIINIYLIMIAYYKKFIKDYY